MNIKITSSNQTMNAILRRTDGHVRDRSRRIWRTTRWERGQKCISPVSHSLSPSSYLNIFHKRSFPILCTNVDWEHRCRHSRSPIFSTRRKEEFHRCHQKVGWWFQWGSAFLSVPNAFSSYDTRLHHPDSNAASVAYAPFRYNVKHPSISLRTATSSPMTTNVGQRSERRDIYLQERVLLCSLTAFDVLLVQLTLATWIETITCRWSTVSEGKPLLSAFSFVHVFVVYFSDKTRQTLSGTGHTSSLTTFQYEG